MGRMNFCPRCGSESLERLKTYSHCCQCLLFIDHQGPGDSDLYDGRYERPKQLERNKQEEKEFEEIETEILELEKDDESIRNENAK